MCDETSGTAYAYVRKCLLTYLRLFGESPQEDIVRASHYWAEVLVSIELEDDSVLGDSDGGEI